MWLNYKTRKNKLQASTTCHMLLTQADEVPDLPASKAPKEKGAKKKSPKGAPKTKKAGSEKKQKKSLLPRLRARAMNSPHMAKPKRSFLCSFLVMHFFLHKLVKGCLVHPISLNSPCAAQVPAWWPRSPESSGNCLEGELNSCRAVGTDEWVRAEAPPVQIRAKF